MADHSFASQYRSSAGTFVESPRPSIQIDRAIHIDQAQDTLRSDVHSKEDTTRYDSFREMIGTAVFVYIALSGVHQAALATLGTQHAVDQIHVALVFAIGLTAGIYTAGPSGGHLNPAVSFTFFLAHEISFTRMLSYVMSQLIGGAIGALFVLAVHGSRAYSLKPKYEDALIGMFGTLKDPSNTLISAIVDQYIGSALLMAAIGAIPGSKYKPALVGATLGAIGLFQGTNGFAINMARDLSPRIVSTILYGATPFTSCNEWLWVPVVVPFFGAVTGLVLVRLLA